MAIAGDLMSFGLETAGDFTAVGDLVSSFTLVQNNCSAHLHEDHLIEISTHPLLLPEISRDLQRFQEILRDFKRFPG